MGPGPDVQIRLFSATVLVRVLFLSPGALAQLGVVFAKAARSTNELAGEFVSVRHASLLAGPSMAAGSCFRDDLVGLVNGAAALVRPALIFRVPVPGTGYGGGRRARLGSRTALIRGRRGVGGRGRSQSEVGNRGAGCRRARA